MAGYLHDVLLLAILESLVLFAPAEGTRNPHASELLPSLSQFSSIGSPTEQTLYAFEGGSDGREPMGGLLADARGGLYGTVLQGGGQGEGQGCALTGCGAVFKLTPGPSGYTESIVYGFSGPDHNDGDGPYGALVADNSGALYGTTSTGGGGLACEGNGCGTVFKLSQSKSGYRETILYVFQGGSDGAGPLAGVVADENGALYGTTYGGGGSGCYGGCGTVFKLKRSGSVYKEEVLHRFTGVPDGGNPYAGLTTGENGTLYGTTVQGGNGTGCQGYGCGTVFKLTPTRSGYHETVVYSFKGGSDGQGPESQLVADKHAALFGTTGSGGGTTCFFGEGCGTVFKLAPSDSGYKEQILHRFGKTHTDDGFSPVAGLIRLRDGSFYGTTLDGGEPNYNGYGTVYRLRPVGSRYVEYVIHAFHYTTDGAYPYAGLVVANGTLFGATGLGGGSMTCGGRGRNGCGVVFSIQIGR